jgi:microcompartment protein CcmK/EutM
MFLARVLGNVVATVKDPGLRFYKLLILQPITPAREPFGDPVVAVDSAGVGVGEEVFYVRGREASFPFLPDEVPTDVGIVGKVDSIDARAAFSPAPSPPAAQPPPRPAGKRGRR